MKGLLILVLLLYVINLTAQDDRNDYSWWNAQHGWKEGDPGWRNWIRITPGFLGPNALPVPEVKKGLIEEDTEAEFTFSNHARRGDPTQDISARFYKPFAGNKVAVEVYGVVVERFAFSEEIRNERFARDYDGRGVAFGDLYFSTLIQLSRNRRFPNTLLRMAGKTASGNQLEAARYTDSPGYFFDLSFSKSWGTRERGLFQPFGMLGFYSWQTNDELNLQNDAFLYGAGAGYFKSSWTFSASLAGYTGYKNEHDRPVQVNFDFRKDFQVSALRFQYQHGLRDWNYKTVRISYIRKFKAAE